MDKIKSGIEKLKYFDAYPKFDEELQEKTFVGGTVSVLCWVTILLLISLRIHEFATKHQTEETIFVDTSRGPKLRINLDITLNQISCGYLSVDAMDSSGEQHLHVDHNVFKRRLDLSGNPLGELSPTKEEVGSSEVANIEKKEGANENTTQECGSCYGAEMPSMNITCCNTCEEVKEAYNLRRWHLQIENVEQCKSLKEVKEISNAFKEGCQVYGYMEVNRVDGSFHIGPGRSFSINHVHVHDVQPYSSSSFNTTHQIDQLTFGSYSERGLSQKVQDKININPLAGIKSVATAGATMFHYYIKIVPTLVKADGRTQQTYQYSVTKHVKVVTPVNKETGMPGVFFSYELSALMHQVTAKAEPWSHLATEICSIIGGVWIVAMFIDYVLYNSSKIIKQKIELGKAT